MSEPFVLRHDELVSRFIHSKDHIRRFNRRPKPGAFDPSPYMELSVVHTSGLTGTEFWDVGKQTLTTAPGRNKLHARADILVQCLHDVNLRALRDDKPFPRHTSVVDWPLGSDPNETKARWKQICLELSEDPRIALEIPEAPVTRD